MSAEQSPYREQARLLQLAPLGSRVLPSSSGVSALLESARALLFPEAGDNTAPADVERGLQDYQQDLASQIQRALTCQIDEHDKSSDAESDARAISIRLIEQLPELQQTLRGDVQAAYDGDPSLYFLEEAIICFPGITALISYRVAHALHCMGVPFIPRMMTENAHSQTGIDIHPAAKIGKNFFIDHGTGVVIGETAIIGDRVRLYQGVTLGSKSFSTTPDGRLIKGEPRHPILEDDVVVYSGASILGRITIGRGSVIGGNVWVTRDVSPGNLVTQARVMSSEYSNGAGI
jgi:serine O-acetyltransferase